MKQSSYRGCLLGLAVGDAMGYSVDSRSWAEIQEDYGPNGLLGYDLANGYADVTSYTQLAAFTCNGLLLGLTRGQMLGKMAPFVKYIGLSSREWAASQRPWGRPERTFCWLSQTPELCRRHCMDTRMLDILNRDPLGTPEEPVNNYAHPGALSTAIGVGLFFDRRRMALSETERLGAEAVALTHGSPLAFLTGAMLTHIISLCLRHPEVPLKALVKHAMAGIREQFGHQYSQCGELAALLRAAVSLADDPGYTSYDVMEKLRCENAAQVLAGAVYAMAFGGEEFDASMIIAVNHSGRSTAVGAVTGALLGLRHGEEALPGFYMECLEPVEILMELADDLYHGCPLEMGNRLFDLEWDRKYVHGGR